MAGYVLTFFTCYLGYTFSHHFYLVIEDFLITLQVCALFTLNSFFTKNMKLFTKCILYFISFAFSFQLNVANKLAYLDMTMTESGMHR